MHILNAMPDCSSSITRARCCALPDRFVFRLFFYAVCLSLAVPGLCRAAARAETPASWRLSFAEHQAAPEHLIAVDKSQQKLSLLERRSPLRGIRQFACSTGQIEGNKEKEGDLKTPEGIYFVVQRIGSGLEFLKYGNEAYTLNYPNPVDRLLKKSGYGIWIHGRGEALVPLQTQGCVSMNNEDLASIGKNLLPGAPVALTESFSFSPEESAGEAAAVAALEKKVQDWARAWGQRSPLLFDFYDKQAYSLAQAEPFSRFQAQKERLFRQLPWIRNSIRDIRILRGPGYWVTWFYQDYRAPNLSTSGVRRLYWAKNAKGDFKILGMEWLPGMTAGTLLASAEPALPPVEAAPRTEPAPSSAQTVPSGDSPADPDAAARRAAPEASAADGGRGASSTGTAATVAGASAEDTGGHVSGLIESWRAAWQAGDLDAYMAFYAPRAQQGARSGAAAIRAHKRALWSAAAPASLKLDGMRIDVRKDGVTAIMRQEYADGRGGGDTGVKTLIFEHIGNRWLIMQEKWSPLPNEAHH